MSTRAMNCALATVAVAVVCVSVELGWHWNVVIWGVVFAQALHAAVTE
jgi:hypothetical protein